MRGQSGKRHILTKKSRTRKRRLRREVEQGGALGRTIAQMIS
jgi:ribosomal protein L35